TRARRRRRRWPRRSRVRGVRRAQVAPCGFRPQGWIGKPPHHVCRLLPPRQSPHAAYSWWGVSTIDVVSSHAGTKVLGGGDWALLMRMGDENVAPPSLETAA